MLLVTAGHLTPREAVAAVSGEARALMGPPPAGAAAGARADLPAVRAGDLRTGVAAAPVDRLVLHRGRLVAVARSERTAATTLAE